MSFIETIKRCVAPFKDGKSSGKKGPKQLWPAVVVGGWQDEKSDRLVPLRHRGPEHCIVVAPTRSGKDVSLLTPTCFEWTGSMFYWDIKGEGEALTAGYRERVMGQQVLRFEPASASGNSVCFNPLDTVRVRTEFETKDMQVLAQSIVKSDGDKDDHWVRSGRDLFTGVALHVAYAEPRKSLRGVVDFLTGSGFESDKDMWEYMANYEHDPAGKMGWTDLKGQPMKTHPRVRAEATKMLSKADNERMSVLGTLNGYLGLYGDDLVARHTDTSSFKVEDLQHSDKPVSLYFVASTADQVRLTPLVSLMVQVIVSRLTESMAFRNGRGTRGYKHRLLMMLNEFPSMGRMELVEKSMAFTAGYGIKYYIATQSVQQIRKTYTDKNSILENCHVQTYFAPNGQEDADMISKMAGKRTIIEVTESFSGDRAQMYLKNTSQSVSKTARDLLTPDEAMRLPYEEMLCKVTGHRMIRGRKLMYFKDPFYLKCARTPTTYTVLEGRPLQVPMSFGDEIDDYSRLEYKLVTGPAGMAFDNLGGYIVWDKATQPGKYQIQVEAKSMDEDKSYSFAFRLVVRPEAKRGSTVLAGWDTNDVALLDEFTQSGDAADSELPGEEEALTPQEAEVVRLAQQRLQQQRLQELHALGGGEPDDEPVTVREMMGLAPLAEPATQADDAGDEMTPWLAAIEPQAAAPAGVDMETGEIMEASASRFEPSQEPQEAPIEQSSPAEQGEQEDRTSQQPQENTGTRFEDLL